MSMGLPGRLIAWRVHVDKLMKQLLEDWDGCKMMR